MLKKIVLNIAFLLTVFAVQGQNLGTPQGTFHKLAIPKTGVYKLDLNFFKTIPNFPKNINPKKIHLFVFPESILPQKNNSPINDNWTEIAVFTEDVNNILEKNEGIYFYAEGPHKINYSNGTFEQTENIYADSSFVLLQINEINGKEIPKLSSESYSNPPIYEFTHFEHIDFTSRNLLNSGRLWVGNFFNSSFQHKFNIEGLVENTATLKSSVLGTMYSSQDLVVTANSNEIGKHSFELTKYNSRSIDANTRYAKIGDLSTEYFQFKPTGNSVTVDFKFINTLNSPSGAYIDAISINCKRKLQFYENQTLVYIEEKDLFNTLVINTNSLNQNIWNVRDPLNPTELVAETKENLKKIQLSSKSELGKLVFWNPSNAFIPIYQKQTELINLGSHETPSLLLISPEKFLTEANILAQHRIQKNNISSLVLSTEEVYTKFSGGKPDISAIRNLCKYFWKTDSSKFKYLLIFGDTSFDPKNNSNFRYVNPKDLIPTYESLESLEPIYSYSSDDYFGFLEPHEGEWKEGSRIDGFWYSNYDNDHTLDISVGRLPINTKEEAQNLVNKLVNYDKIENLTDNWRLNLNFVADDGDYNLHQRDAETLSEKTAGIFTRKKIFLDSYSQVSTPNGTRAPLATNALNKAIENGSFLINYNGHGSEIGWTDEKLLTIDEINSWRNFNKLAIFFTATCQFGKFDNPSQTSGAELALINPRGGAIALLTTTRPVYSTSNYTINEAFLKSLGQEKHKNLGDLFKTTKNSSIIGENNRNFSLLGDPSMPLNIPSKGIRINSISEKKPEEVQLKALENYTLKGSLDSPNFEGKISIKIYDKPSQSFTLGIDKENPKMSYIVDNNILYSGIVKVSKSNFTLNFTVPKDINYQVGKGSIKMFAISNDSLSIYSDIFQDLSIGGSKEIIDLSDTKGPEVDFVYANNQLQLTIIDESGINITNNSIAKGIIFNFNDTLQVNVSEYYQNIETIGQLNYDVSSFKPGTYKLELIIWDVYNNKTIKTFEFNIDEPNFNITELWQYPNPVTDFANFKLRHNRAGDDIELRFKIVDNLGKIHYSSNKNCFSCDNTIEFGLNFDTIKLVEGKYIYSINLKSLNLNKEIKRASKVLFWK